MNTGTLIITIATVALWFIGGAIFGIAPVLMLRSTIALDRTLKDPSSLPRRRALNLRHLVLGALGMALLILLVWGMALVAPPNDLTSAAAVLGAVLGGGFFAWRVFFKGRSA